MRFGTNAWSDPFFVDRTVYQRKSESRRRSKSIITKDWKCQRPNWKRETVVVSCFTARVDRLYLNFSRDTHGCQSGGLYKALISTLIN